MHDAPDTPNAWLTVEQVASLTAFSAYTIRKAARDGHLTGFHPAGMARVWRFRAEDVTAWITGSAS